MGSDCWHPQKCKNRTLTCGKIRLSCRYWQCVHCLNQCLQLFSKLGVMMILRILKLVSSFFVLLCSLWWVNFQHRSIRESQQASVVAFREIFISWCQRVQS
jgi:hypothetical protein